MIPRVSKARHVVAASIVILHTRHSSNIVLLDNGETWAGHDCIDEAVHELFGKTFKAGAAGRVRIEMIAQLVKQGAHEVLTGIVDVMLLADGDKLGHIPGQLLQS
jgi:hypothetical protein